LTKLHQEEIVVTPRPGTAFDALMRYRAYDGVTITELTSTPATIERRTREPAPPYTEIVLQDVGTTDNTLNGVAIRLDAGAVMMTTSPCAYTVTFEATTRRLVLRLPTARLAARIENPAQYIATRVEACHAVLLSSFLHTMFALPEPPCAPCEGQAIADVLVDLIALTYHPRPSSTSSSAVTSARWQQAVRDFVDQHLGDPELGAPMIAQHLGVTPRYVQMMFAKMTTTPSAYICKRRLELAAQLLIAGRDPITEVAARAGFADLSYFYRSFRKQYGLSPRRYAAR